MKKIGFFDLDYTLWKTPAKLVVILKDKPEQIIYRIPLDEISMMGSFYKKYNLPVDYNGNTFYLSQKMWEDIKKIDLDKIGISYREWTNEELLENQIPKTEYLLDNIKHLKDSYCDIAFLTARSNKDKHKENISVLVKKVEDKINKRVKKVYFVNDSDNNFNSDISSSRKAKVLLEHLIGYKIKDNCFTELKQDVYEGVSLYDDEKKNIEVVNNLQILFEKMLVRTEYDLKEEIIKRVQDNRLYYTTYTITSNKLNPFIKSEKVLVSPENILNFREFNK